MPPATPCDPALSRAIALGADAAHRGPEVQAFFDPATFTVTYVVEDPVTRAAAVIDSVLDFEPACGRISTRSADLIVAFVEDRGLSVQWHLETHLHADHLSAGAYLKSRLGGRLAIGQGVQSVCAAFGQVFGDAANVDRPEAQFDCLWRDGDELEIGGLRGVVLHAPGHTPADVAYVLGDAVFVGDTLFMPDYGTARADFPGGDAARLFHSIRRLLDLPPQTRMFLCHDYKAPGREEFAWETTVERQRDANIHVRDVIDEAEFVALRRARDRDLATPRLMLPSVQVNMRGGRLPEPEANGIVYLRIPINAL